MKSSSPKDLNYYELFLLCYETVGNFIARKSLRKHHFDIIINEAKMPFKYNLFLTFIVMFISEDKLF